MAGISAYDSNSISTLFSSLSTSSKSGASDMLGINYSDYSCIKSGSYYKLMKSYYAKVEGSDSKTSSSLSTSEDSTQTLAEVKNGAKSLSDTASEIYKDSSLFKEKTITSEDGKTTTGVDYDQLYSKLKSFVSDYNTVIGAAGKSNTDGIANAAANLVNYTNINSSMLEGIGIKISDKDYTLSIDEDKLKSASMTSVTSLFKGTGSFAYGVAVKASMIEAQAQKEAGKANTYSRTGSYSRTYTAGDIFNSET